MMKTRTNARLATTAIAAVLAFTSASALAQVADPLAPSATETVTPMPEPAAPVVETPVDPVPVETTTTTTTTTTAVPAAPKAVAKKTVAKPTPAPKPAVTARTSSSAPSPTVPASSADAPAAAATIPPLPSAEPATPPLEAEPPVAAPTQSAAVNDDLPLMAGAAGLAAVALLGTGIVASRRRRRRDEMIVEDVPTTEPQMARPAPVPPVQASNERSAFAWGRNGTDAPVATTAPTQKLPNGFDVSRYGRHVQAAYRGPTPDNPSLSLKRRIKRASFFDLRERQAGTARSGFARSPELMPA